MKKLFTVLSAAVLVAAVAAVYAQDPGAPREPGKPGGARYFEKKEKEPETARSVEGKVLASDEKTVEGAVVQLKDTKTLRIRSYITLADGSYHFHGLSPDTDYEIKASKDDAESQTRRLTVYDSRKKATIDLRLRPKG
ncbi:MAG: carboxypeptidase regulatory-like domain-containing protein [Bryobacteraceae bacterium]|nr:carboxypeptidase regulatory-like domain-containing protein [Bryobacteraceae bacterium]